MRLIVEDRVVRDRRAVPGTRTPKARWLLHTADCVFAPGCTPLADLVAEVGEAGVLARVRRGMVARCRTCQPTFVERTLQSR